MNVKGFLVVVVAFFSLLSMPQHSAAQFSKGTVIQLVNKNTGKAAAANASRVSCVERNSADYSTVKPKFFEAVYNKIDRSENAKPVKEQLDTIKQTYEEYFLPTEEPPKSPVFGAQTKGEPPKGDGCENFSKYWGFVPQKKE